MEIWYYLPVPKNGDLSIDKNWRPVYPTKLVFMFNSKHSLQIKLKIKIKMSRKRTIKQREIDDKISMTLDSINKLLLLNIILARLRLNGIIMDLNKYMRMYNGNKKNLKIMYQNIPGTLSKINTLTTLTSLLYRTNPDIIGIAEPETNDLDIDWDCYTLVKGHVEGGEKIRLNVLIKNNIPFTQRFWKVKIPHIIIEACGWTTVFLYREWALCGD